MNYLIVLIAISISSLLAAQDITIPKVQAIVDHLQLTPEKEYQIMEHYTAQLGTMELISAVKYCDSSFCSCSQSATSFNRHYGLRRKDGVILKPLYNRIAEWGNNYLLYLSCYLKEEVASEWTVKEYGNDWMVEIDGDFKVVKLHQDVAFSGKSFLVEKNEKYGVMNNEMELIVECKYDNLTKFSSDNEYYFNYPSLEYSEHLKSIAAKNDNKWGMLTEDGRIMIPFKYDFLINLKNGSTVASLDNKWGIIDKYDSIIVPFEFDLIQRVDRSYLVKKDGKVAIMKNVKDYSNLKYDYNDMFYATNGLHFLKKGKLWSPYEAGYDSRMGNYAFAEIVDGGSRFILVGKRNKYAVMGVSGTILTDYVYSAIKSEIEHQGLQEHTYSNDSYMYYELILLQNKREVSVLFDYRD